LGALGKLGINLGYLITQIVNLLLMIGLMYAVAYRPIVKMLRQRRERIAEGVNNARKAEEALASAESDRQKVLDEARAEAQKIVTEARTRAEEAAGQIRTEAEEEARRIRTQAEADAASERDRLLADMRGQIISLSMAAAGHLIGSNLDDQQQRRLVEEFFTSIPEEARGLGDSLVVVTAVPLTEGEVKRFKKELGTDDIIFQTDPGILGGVVVRSGGRQFDASFASQLASLRGALS
jgi:F-type H+-transporting ATPase subunit b